jgi:hypothetical protein
MIRTLFLAIACAFVAAAPTFATAPASNAGGAEPTVGAATVPHLYDNCTNYNKKYPHDVGKAGARDKTKSKTAESVTTFKRSTKLYNLAVRYNSGLDRDKDGVACEEK